MPLVRCMELNQQRRNINFLSGIAKSDYYVSRVFRR